MSQFFENVITSTRMIWKGIIIVILTFVFQIPVFLVDHLISEREKLSNNVVNDIAGKWGGEQIVGTPLLEVPALSDKSAVRTVMILPDACAVQASLSPELRKRGIYEAALYSSDIKFQGQFDSVDALRLPVAANELDWARAKVKLYVRDAKGLASTVKLNWSGQELALRPAVWSGGASKYFVAPIALSGPDALKSLQFNGALSLNGASRIQFLPLAAETRVKVSSSWQDPSFIGDAIPQKKTVDAKGFTAEWVSLAQNRNYPNIWANDEFDMMEGAPARDYGSGSFDLGSSDVSRAEPVANPKNLLNAGFGVRLYVTVNDYQKSHRLVRYSILYILLTLAAFFLVEIRMKRSIHPIQYTLIGLALTLFFMLQLSISEYLGFDWSYLIAALMIILSLAWFTRGVLQSARGVTILTVVLVIIYGYMFSLMQVADYALLLGSLGLFLMLLALMSTFRFQFKTSKDPHEDQNDPSIAYGG